MKRLGGPEIKLSGLKVPTVLRDLYADLRDRRLLPVVVLLIVTIVAAPILIGNSSGPEEEESVATPSAAGPGKASGTVVVTAATPGLRRYQRRLGHLHADDPFRPKFAPVEEGESSSEASTATSGGPTEVVEPPTTSTPTTSGGNGGGADSPPQNETVPGHPEATPSEPSERAPESLPATPSEPGQTKVRYFTYAIDARVVNVPGNNENGEGEDGESAKQPEPESSTRHNLPPLTMLPGRKTPALTYIGPSKDGEKAVMLISGEVTGLFGEATCVEGSAEHCQLLALEPGLPETVIYGPAERTYRIELIKIQMLTTKKLNRAPLGEPKKGKETTSDSGG
jgi:hypothetical protein